MAEQSASHDEPLVTGYPSLQAAVANEIVPEELARRRRLFVRARQLRKENGSIGIASDDLIHESRQEDDE
jgi:hypothetical protein